MQRTLGTASQTSYNCSRYAENTWYNLTNQPWLL